MCDLVKQIKKKGYAPDSRWQSLPHGELENRGLFGILFSSKFFFFLDAVFLGTAHSCCFFYKNLVECKNNKNTWNYSIQ